MLQLGATAGRRDMEGTQPSAAGGDGAPTARVILSSGRALQRNHYSKHRHRPSAQWYISGAPPKEAKSRALGEVNSANERSAEISISNYLKVVVWIAISKFEFSLQPNYSQYVLVSGQCGCLLAGVHT